MIGLNIMKTLFPPTNMKIEAFLFHVNRLDLRLKIQIPRQTKKTPNPS